MKRVYLLEIRARLLVDEMEILKLVLPDWPEKGLDDVLITRYGAEEWSYAPEHGEGVIQVFGEEDLMAALKYDLEKLR